METEDRQPNDMRAIEEQMDAELDETAELQARLDEAEREKDQFRQLALRSQADLDNYRKRMVGEMAETRERANERLLLRLIGVADDFSRAVDHMPDDVGGEGWIEGVRLVHRGIENILLTEGITRIEAAVGQPFDVYEHEAVFSEPTDEVEEGAVARVVGAGYKLHDRVLRAAKVSVAQPPPRQSQTERHHTEHHTDQQEAR